MTEKRRTLIKHTTNGKSNNLLSEESNRLKTLFDRFDVDKTGVINAKEMKVILQLAQLDKLAETICDDITRLNFSEFMNKFKTMPISEEQLELLKKIPVDAANRIGIELRENPNSFQITADEKFNISTQRVLRCKQAFDILDIDLSGRITQEALTSQLQKIGIKFDAAKLNNIFKHADNDDAKEFSLGDFVLASCSKRSSTSVRNLRLIAKELAKIIYCSNGESPQGKSLETAEQLFVDSATYQKMPGYKPDKFYFIFNAFDDLDYNLDGVLSKNNLKVQNHEEFNPNEKQMYEILCLAWEDHNLYFDDFYKYMVLAPIDVRILATTARKIGNFFNNMPNDGTDALLKIEFPRQEGRKGLLSSPMLGGKSLTMPAATTRSETEKKSGPSSIQEDLKAKKQDLQNAHLNDKSNLILKELADKEKIITSLKKEVEEKSKAMNSCIEEINALRTQKDKEIADLNETHSKKIQELMEENNRISNENKANQTCKNCENSQRGTSNKPIDAIVSSLKSDFEIDSLDPSHKGKSIEAQLLESQAFVKKLQLQITEKDKVIQRLQQPPNPNDPQVYDSVIDDPHSTESLDKKRINRQDLAIEISRQLDARETSTRQEMEKLHAQIKLFEEDKKKSQKLIEELNEQIKVLESKNETLENEVNARIKAAERLRSEIKERNETISEITDKAKINVDLTERVDRLGLQIIKKTADSSKMFDSLSSYKKKSKDLQHNLNDLTEQVKQLEAKNEELRKGKELKTAEVIDLNEKLKKIANENQILEEMLKGREETIVRLNKRIERNKQLVGNLSKPADGAKKDPSFIESSVAQATIDELTFDIKCLEQKLAHVNEELTNKEAQLERQIALTKEKADEKEALEKQFAAASKDYDEKIKELRRMNTDLMLKHNEEINIQNQLKQEIKEKDTALSTFRQAALRKEQNEEDMKAKFSARLQQLIRQCERLTIRNEELLGETKGLKTQVEVKKFEYEVIFDKLSAAKGENERLKLKALESSRHYSKETLESQLAMINAAFATMFKQFAEETKQKILQLEARISKNVTIARGLKDELDKRGEEHAREIEDMQIKLQQYVKSFEGQKNAILKETERAKALEEAFARKVKTLEESYETQINNLLDQISKPKLRKPT